MLPSWLVVAGMSCAFYTIIDMGPFLRCFTFVLQRFFGARRCDGLNLKSLVHSTLAGCAALLSNHWESQLPMPSVERNFLCLPPAAVLTRQLPAFELGYALHDLVEGVRLRQASFFLHGCLVVPFVSYLCYIDIAHQLSRLIIVHLSTIFLNLRRADFGTVGNSAVDVCFFVSFMLLRVVMVPIMLFNFCWYGLVTSDPDRWGSCIDRSGMRAAVVGSVIFVSLNLYWAVLIVQKLLTKFSGKGALRADDGLGRDVAEGHRD